MVGKDLVQIKTDDPLSNRVDGITDNVVSSANRCLVRKDSV